MTAPYGSWPSPISVEALTASTVGLAGGFVDGDDVYWTEGYPSQGGRVSLWRLSGGDVTEVTPDHCVRSTVGEYGGQAATARDGVVVFTSFPDNVVHVVEGGRVRAVTTAGTLRFGGFTITADRRVVCVREDHTASDIACVTTVVVLDLDSGNPDGGRVIASGADFYHQPALAADGRVAWVEWDHPDMPWDTTRLAVGDLDGGRARIIAGGNEESVVHPQWAPDGSLVFCSDSTGYWNFRSWDGRTVRALHDDPYEVCGPAWVLSDPPYAILADGRIGCSWLVDGVSHVGLLDGGHLVDVDLGLDGIVGAELSPGVPVGVVGLDFAAEPSGTYALDWRTSTVTLLRTSLTSAPDPAYVSRASEVTWVGPDGDVHAWYYPPANPEVAAPDGELPPLIVTSHGGPTSYSPPRFSVGRAFWTSRGVGVLDVNYGGSTGYGRAYRNRLRGTWGLTDVRDCCDAALTLVRRGLADPDRLAIMGGSAGGYTTLQALATTDVFSAGISLYGIGDLEALATDTHKFEARYLDGLIAPYPEGRQVYLDRSPIHHLDGLSCPMLILQGADDRVVPVAQAERMAQAVRGKGLPVALRIYPGEGHGFRRAETIRDQYLAILSFLGQVFGFTPAGDVPLLPIENLRAQA